ncbi:MAG: endonuclease/exonuclease/phosphatase family protein [Planctomycetaceae bacterium]
MRLLSYNIHKGIGGRDRRYRLERIFEVIEEQNPDLVCLQEVDSNVRRSKFHDQPELLAAYFSLEHKLYQLNVKLKSGGYGNLILSRWNFLESSQISLRLNQKKNRGAQMCLIDTPEGKLHLVNWHLGLAEKERHWQARKLLTHTTFREFAQHPTLIIGDTNDWRNNLANGPFAHQDFRHITRPASKFRSFPAYMPMGSLDKLFVNHGLKIKHAHMVRSLKTRDASDHLPLVVDFHFRSPSMSRLEEEISQGAPDPEAGT